MRVNTARPPCAEEEGAVAEQIVDEVEMWVPLARDSAAGANADHAGPAVLREAHDAQGLVRSLRGYALETLTRWSADSATIGDAIVCVDRLVAEVVRRNTSTMIGLRLAALPSQVRVALTEQLSPAQVPVSAQRFATVLSEQLAGLTPRWGVLSDSDQSTAWFELPTRRTASAEPRPDPEPITARHPRAAAPPLRLAGTPDPSGPQACTSGASTPDAAAAECLGPGTHGSDASGDTLVAGGFRIDLITRSVSVADQLQQIRLTGREFELLVHLMRRAGCVQSRRELLRDVWGIDFAADTAVVEVTMSRLRRKLGVRELRTVKDAGYVFSALGESTTAVRTRAGGQWHARQA